MKILFISLGCDKNLVDSEEMLGLLNSRGYTFTDDETEADVIIINTCCFINDAKEESVQTILEMAEYKKTGKCKALIVTGCMAQRYKQEILDEVSEVDQVLGTTAYEKIVEAVDEALAGSRGVEENPLSYLPQTDAKRMVTTGGHYAYLKIAEGCNKCCTYCIIPKLRGRYRSVPMERLIEQAKELAAQGVKELILVAQETTVYGVDLYGKKSLHLLLEQLCQISGLRWIRILYCYPEEIYEDLIQTMKREEKICHYLDLPIQHASDAVLRRMGRRTTRADLEQIVTHLREEIPDIVSASGIIWDKLFKPHRCACLLRAMKHSGQPAVYLPRRLMQGIQLCLRFFAAVLRKIGQKHPDLIKAGLFILTYDMCHPALLSVYFAPAKLI